MLNDKFETFHLHERSYTTPLFFKAKEAYSATNHPSKHTTRYLVIDSDLTMP